MRLRPVFVLLLMQFAACYHISTQRSVYRSATLETGDSVAVVFAYEAGRLEQTAGASPSVRSVREGQRVRFLALRDDIEFALRDAGIPVAPQSRARFHIEMTPTTREAGCAVTCNVIQTLSFAVVQANAPDVPLARVRFENAKGGHAKGNDTDFVKKAARELIAVLKGATK